MSETPVCLVGLPGAGKTTFLAAFWAATRDVPRPGAYSIVGFPADPTYLQKIADSWFDAKPVERNTTASVEPIELDLRAEGRMNLQLRVPDLNGESFRDAAAHRQIDKHVAELVGGSELILFFVNAATARTHVSLADMPPDPPSEKPPPPYEEFDPKKLESDILNAELLHLLPQLVPTPERPPPIVVVVSAWDTVDALQQPPRTWLSRQQPMFAQTLDEYARRAQVQVIGVSAQGADYESTPGVAQKPPDERPLVVDGSTRSADIGLPFAWFDDLRRSSR